MRYFICIPHDGSRFYYPLLYHSDFQCIDVDGVVLLYIWKIHNHKYQLEGFFYSSKVIISCRTFGTKQELYGAIQKLLQEYL